MPLPIPHILESALKSADSETRASLDLFEALVTRIEPAAKREIRFRRDVALEFPQIAASYLLSSLQRLRVTSWGVISALNAPNEVLFAMSVRGLLESAANLAHLRANLQRTFSGEMVRKDMTYLALRMKFATRKPDDAGYTAEEASRVSSVRRSSASRHRVDTCAWVVGFCRGRLLCR